VYEIAVLEVRPRDSNKAVSIVECDMQVTTIGEGVNKPVRTVLASLPDA
jgi:hypothetical protein